MSSSFKPPVVPAAFFGMVLGLAGLANAWRAAHRVWGLPAAIGEVLTAIAVGVWVVLMALFVAKWLWARDDALAEARHPIQCCFIGLAGVSTLLMTGSVLPYAHALAEVLFVVGGLFTIAFAVWRTGGLWQGGRDPSTTTPVLYLPTVGSGFVGAVACVALGYGAWAPYAFGLGLFAWLAIESALLYRLYNVAALPPPLRPTLGIQLAPATVGTLAYLAIHDGPPDWIAHAMLGYGVVIALVLVRLLPWIREQPFSAGYWGFTFGITALMAAPIRMIEKGDTGPAATLAPITFVLGNLVMLVIVVATLRLLVGGRLLPAPAAPPVVERA